MGIAEGIEAELMTKLLEVFLMLNTPLGSTWDYIERDPERWRRDLWTRRN